MVHVRSRNFLLGLELDGGRTQTNCRFSTIARSDIGVRSDALRISELGQRRAEPAWRHPRTPRACFAWITAAILSKITEYRTHTHAILLLRCLCPPKFSHSLPTHI